VKSKLNKGQQMKKTLILSAVTASLLAGVQYANANVAPLAPGGSVTFSGTTGQVAPPGPGATSTLVAFESTPIATTFGSGVGSGTVSSWVYSGDASNPLGGYTFVYEVNVASGDGFAAAAFQTFLGAVDVGYVNFAGTPAPTGSSSGGSGNPVNFTFGKDEIGGTDYLIVDTSVNSFAPGFVLLQDGGQSAAGIFAEAGPVPDGGTTMVMLGGAFCVLGAIRRKLS
jgi:hypothetical protein